MKWKEFEIEKPSFKYKSSRYLHCISFSKNNWDCILNTLFSSDKRVVGKQYYKIYITNKPLGLAIVFSNVIKKNSGRLFWFDGGSGKKKRSRFFNKNLMTRYDLKGKVFSFKWNSKSKMFIGLEA